MYKILLFLLSLTVGNIGYCEQISNTVITLEVIGHKSDPVIVEKKVENIKPIAHIVKKKQMKSRVVKKQNTDIFYNKKAQNTTPKIIVTPVKIKSLESLIIDDTTYSNNDIVISTIYNSKTSYSIAGILCRMFNNSLKNNNSKCSVLQFGNEFALTNNLTHNNRAFGVIASDSAYNIVKKNGQSVNIRFVKSLYYNPLLLIGDTDISNINNKKIGILNNQQSLTLLHHIIDSLQLNNIKIIKFTDYQNLTEALKNNDIDIVAVQDYYPNKNIIKIIKDCDAKIIQFNDIDIKKIISKNGGYKKIIIPDNIYDTNPIVSIGTTVDLVVNKGQDGFVDKMLKSISNKALLTTSHPAMIDSLVYDIEQNSVFRFYNERRG